MMSIIHEQIEDGRWIIRVNGRLDQSLTPRLAEHLEQLLETEPSQITVDMQHVTYINSNGLRCLVSSWRRARQQGGDIILCSLSPRLQEIFEMVGFDKIFVIQTACEERDSKLEIGD